jgi:hypothetical protein
MRPCAIARDVGHPLWFLAWGLALAILHADLPASAQSGRRYAIVVGVNAGDPGETMLRYAAADAQRMGRVLRELGGFFPENVLVLTEVSAPDLRRTLIALNARLREVGGESLLFVYYSGHADAEALHLDRTRLGLAELRDLVSGSAATARVLVIDACRSGALTRVKGGRPGPKFDIALDHRLSRARGTAFLTSSAAGEDSHESDRLGGSFFTHYLLSGLVGAADRDDDGVVSLGEAYAYAAERTTAATATSVSGPQHPTFRYALSGHDDLPLTWPSSARRRGLLVFRQPGVYLVQRGGRAGRLVAEVASETAGRRIALAPGRYLVTRRGIDHLLQAGYLVQAGQTTAVDPARMQRVEYARVVRKGGSAKKLALSAWAQGGARGSLLDLGPAWRADVVGRLDLAPLALEVRVGLGFSGTTNYRVEIKSRELVASVAALRAFDLGPVTLAVGVEIGGLWLAQVFNDSRTPDRDGSGLLLGPAFQIEVPVIGRLSFRLDAAVLTYFIRSSSQRTGNVPTEVTWETPVTYRLLAGLGVYF